MTDENDMLLLTSFVALGIFIVSVITAYLHSILVLPLVIIGLIFVPLILLQNNEKFAHLSEKLETCAFFITLIIIIIAFIWLYAPV